MSREAIRLVDEPLLNGEAGCTICSTTVGQFLELPLPSRLIGAAGFGAFYLCGSCFEAACQAGGVVSQERFDEVRARAEEAEAMAEGMTSAAKTAAAEARKRERQLELAEGRATAAEGNLAAVKRRLDELLADPKVREREDLFARIAATAAERQEKDA